MDILRVLDLLVLALVVSTFCFAVVRSYSMATHPLLWFAVGLTLFIHVGSLRDFLTGTLYEHSLEWQFRSIEFLHIACIALGFGLATRKRAPASFPNSSLRIHLPTYAVVLAVSIVLKLWSSNPFTVFDETASNYFRLLAFFSVAAGCLSLAAFETNRHRVRGLMLAAFGTLSFLILVAWTFSPSRTPMMYAFACFICYLIWRNRSYRVGLRRQILLASLPFFAFSALVIGSGLKGYAVHIQYDVPEDEAREKAVYHGKNLEFIDAYENGLFAFATHPRPYDYREGESFAALVLGLVPRRLWKHKPYGYSYHFTAEKLGHRVRDSGLSLATSLIGDLWANGGWISVTLFSLFFGFVMGKLNRWSRRNINSVIHQLIYWQFLFMCLLSSRGDLYSIFQRGTFFMVFTWICARLVARMHAPSAATVQIHHDTGPLLNSNVGKNFG